MSVFSFLGIYQQGNRVSLVEKTNTGIRILDRRNIHFALIQEDSFPNERFIYLGPLDMQETELQEALSRNSLSPHPARQVYENSTSCVAHESLAAFFDQTVVMGRDESANELEDRRGDHCTSEATPHNGTAVEDRITRAIAFMENNFREDLTLGQIARTACLSPCYFCRLLKRRFGTTCSQMLSSIRVREATRLLKGTALRVTDVCFETGFNDLTHFERVFKKILGMTPSKYRHRA